MKTSTMFASFLLTMCISWMPTYGQTHPDQAGVETQGFDVVSVRVNNSGGEALTLTPTPNGYELRNVSLQRLLSIAYNLRENQVSGLPAWANSTRFDIVAKATNFDTVKQKPLTWPDRQKYLAIILVERFHLSSHMETKPGRVLNLMTEPGALKLRPSGSTDAKPNVESNDDTQFRGDILLTDRFMKGKSVPISLLAKNLQIVLKQDVTDITGLTGLYDISLQWVPFEAPPPQPDTPEIRSALFNALHEQLGLKLVSGRAPVQMLVVDHVEMPSSN